MPEMNEPGGRCGVASRGLDQVSRFVSLVYPSPSAWIALCLIPPDHQRPEHRFLSVDRLSRFLAYARYRNAAGWGVYITPSRLKPRAQSAEAVVSRSAKRDLSRLRSSCLPGSHPTAVSLSDVGCQDIPGTVPGLLATRSTRGSSPPGTAPGALAIDVDADRAATDVSRVLRLPGFWNRKPSRNNTVDIVFSRDHCVSYQSLWERVLPSRPATCRPASYQAQRGKPCLCSEGGGSGRNCPRVREIGMTCIDGCLWAIRRRR